MESILELNTSVYFDKEISFKELITFYPYSGTSLSCGSQIRIPIQNKDMITLLSQSDLVIEGKLVKSDGSAGTSAIINNGLAYLFDLIRYEMNDKEICTVYNPGVTSSIINHTLLTPDQVKGLSNAGWTGDLDKVNQCTSGSFQCILPLSIIIPFFASYAKILNNVKHELILVRSRTDDNVLFFNTPGLDEHIEISKIAWRVPILQLNDAAKLNLLQFIENDTSVFLPFRNWQLHTYPTLPTATRHLWTVKSTSSLDTPRFVLFALQTDRIDQKKKNNALFDHNNISSIRLFLNEKQYPQQDVYFDPSKTEFSHMYDMFLRMRKAYFAVNEDRTCWDYSSFISKIPFICFDCSRQPENTSSNNCVDVRIELEFIQQVPAKTTAYAIIISDSLFELKMQSGDIKKII